MEFGLQDEVAASCGEWVALDNVPLLKKRYPELAKIVAEELLGGWGVSEQSQQHYIGADRARSQAVRRSGLSWSSVLVVIFVLGLGSFTFLYKSGKLPGGIVAKRRFPDPAAVDKALREGRMPQFESLMEQRMAELLPLVSKSRSAYNAWIPYIRALAFHRSGTIAGLSPKLLQGMGSFSAPIDCSLNAWLQRWQDSRGEWQSYLQGETMASGGEWQKILLWDPFWVGRRRQTPGWIRPSNYYQGCLNMALRAARRYQQTLVAEANPEDEASLFAVSNIAMIVSRLNLTISISSRDRAVRYDTADSPVLSFVGCVDSKPTVGKLEECTLDTNMSEAWQVYLTSYKQRRQAHLFLVNQSVLTDDSLVTLTKLHRLQKQIDPITEFSYRPELRYLVAIMLNNGSLREATRRMKYEFPDIDFSH